MDFSFLSTTWKTSLNETSGVQERVLRSEKSENLAKLFAKFEAVMRELDIRDETPIFVTLSLSHE